MDEANREKFLSTKQPAQTEVLRRKLEEYSAMPRQERELRLRQLELCRWLLPLMRLEAQARAEPLSDIPTRDRSVVEERLREWDALAAPQKESVLKDKTVLSYFFRPEPAFIQRQMDLMTIMPPKLKAKLEEELALWRGRSVAEREIMRIRLNQLLKLKQEEREKVITEIVPVDNQSLRSTLSLFLQLTPEQRERCVEGFGKLANLPPAEREQFIFDASRWRAMSAEQRDLWRLMILRVRAPSSPGPSPLDAVRLSSPTRPNSLVTNE